MKISNHFSLVCFVVSLSVFFDLCNGGLLGLDDGLLSDDGLLGQVITGSKGKKKSNRNSNRALINLSEGATGILRSLVGSVVEVTNGLPSILPRGTLDLFKRPYDHPICYDDDIYGCGPLSWEGTCKDGKRQSPIDIRTKNQDEIQQDTNSSANPLIYNSPYSKLRNFYLSNNGHSISIKVEPSSTSDAQVLVVDMTLNYHFSFLHFHWGSDTSKGSEHLIDGKSFPLEMHMVHHRDVYNDAEHAFASGGDDVAALVIAVFVTVGEDDNPAFNSIVDAISAKGKRDTNGYMLTGKMVNLHDLLPQKDQFYRYKGSLTVPTCTEKVLWIVYPKPIEISKYQMAAFRKVERKFEEQPMSNNFRPVQPLNSRKISYFNYGAKSGSKQ